MSNTIQAATVEVLTAEVRTLQVGARQVTLSVARQLDEVDPDGIEPFGRISTGRKPGFAVTDSIEVIGSASGVLARSVMERHQCVCGDSFVEDSRYLWGGLECIGMPCRKRRDGQDHRDHHWEPAGWDEWYEWEDLPLIVLAGLR